MEKYRYRNDNSSGAYPIVMGTGQTPPYPPIERKTCFLPVTKVRGFHRSSLMNNETESYEDAHNKEGNEDQEKQFVPLQVSQINFHGDEIQVVLVEADGQPRAFVPVRQFC